MDYGGMQGGHNQPQYNQPPQQQQQQPNVFIQQMPLNYPQDQQQATMMNPGQPGSAMHYGSGPSGTGSGMGSMGHHGGPMQGPQQGMQMQQHPDAYGNPPAYPGQQQMGGVPMQNMQQNMQNMQQQQQRGYNTMQQTRAPPMYSTVNSNQMDQQQQQQPQYLPQGQSQQQQFSNMPVQQRQQQNYPTGGGGARMVSPVLQQQLTEGRMQQQQQHQQQQYYHQMQMHQQLQPPNADMSLSTSAHVSAQQASRSPGNVSQQQQYAASSVSSLLTSDQMNASISQQQQITCTVTTRPGVTVSTVPVSGQSMSQYGGGYGGGPGSGGRGPQQMQHSQMQAGSRPAVMQPTQQQQQLGSPAVGRQPRLSSQVASPQQGIASPGAAVSIPAAAAPPSGGSNSNLASDSVVASLLSSSSQGAATTAVPPRSSAAVPVAPPSASAAAMSATSTAIALQQQQQRSLQQSHTAMISQMLENLDQHSPYALCRIGREITQEVVNKSQEIFTQLKTLPIPVSTQQTPQSIQSAHEKQQRLVEMLKYVRLLIKKLQVIHDKLIAEEEALPGPRITPVDLVFVEGCADNGAVKEVIENAKKSEKYLAVLQEHKLVAEDLVRKREQLKQTMEFMRSLTWELNCLTENLVS